MHLKVVHGLPHLSKIKKTLPQLNAHSQWHAHHPTLFAIFHLKDKGTRHLECFGLLLIMGPSLQSPFWVVLSRRSFPQAANSGVNAAWPKSAAEYNQHEANWSIAEATNWVAPCKCLSEDKYFYHITDSAMVLASWSSILMGYRSIVTHYRLMRIFLRKWFV